MKLKMFKLEHQKNNITCLIISDELDPVFGRLEELKVTWLFPLCKMLFFNDHVALMLQLRYYSYHKSGILKDPDHNGQFHLHHFSLL